METGFKPENPIVMGVMIIVAVVGSYFAWQHVMRNSDIYTFCYQQGFDRKRVIEGELFCQNEASGEIKSFGQLEDIPQLAIKK